MRRFKEAARLTLFDYKRIKQWFKFFGEINILNMEELVHKNSICIIKCLTRTTKGSWEACFLLLRIKRWYIVEWDEDEEKLFLRGRNLKTEVMLSKFIKKEYYDMDANLSFLIPFLQNNTVILIGEKPHHTKEMHKLVLNFITFAHKYGYKDIVLEQPYSLTYYYNRYLKTGKEKYYAYIPDEDGILRILCRYNKKLSPNQKLRVWCIDVDHVEIPAIDRIKENIKKIKSETREHLLKRCSYFSYANGSHKLKLESIEDMHRIFSERRERLIRDLGLRRYNEILDVIENLRRSLEIRLKGTFYEREKFIMDKFMHIYEKLKQEESKIIGYFGSMHVQKAPFHGYDTLGTFLTHKYQKTKGKVYTILLLGCEGRFYPYIHKKEVAHIFFGDKLILHALPRSWECIFIDLKKFEEKYFTCNNKNLLMGLYDGLILIKKVHPSKRPSNFYQRLTIRSYVQTS